MGDDLGAKLGAPSLKLVVGVPGYPGDDPFGRQAWRPLIEAARRSASLWPTRPYLGAKLGAPSLKP